MKRGGSAALAAMIKQKSSMLYGDAGTIEGATSPDKGPAPPAETKPEKYQPTTTKFSGANQCCMCNKTVYKMEEVIAVGKVWHDSCFTCGGSNTDGCKRVLKRDGYQDHDNMPYCNACFSKLFKPQGFGYGSALNLDNGTPATSSKQVTPSAKVETPAPTAPTPAPTPASVVSPPPQKPAPPAAAPPAAPAAPTAKAPAAVAPAVGSAAATTKQDAAPVKYSPKVVVNAFNSTPKCTICAKSVYKMEEMIAVGRVWHLNCFTCGGSSDLGCKKVLRRDGYVDHENNPFCLACHAKLFRPKGVGYGAALNTDYGPAPETLVPEVAKVSIESAPSAQVPPSPPAAPPAPPAAVAAVAAKTAASPPAPTVTKTSVAPPSAPPAPPAVASASPSQTRAIAAGAPHALNIGGTSKSVGGVFKEASYVGDNDEVDEAEWN